MKVKDKAHCFYINKIKDGISITLKEAKECKQERLKISLRLPECLIHRLDEHLANQNALVSRTAWILQAIEGRLNKEAR